MEGVAPQDHANICLCKSSHIAWRSLNILPGLHFSISLAKDSAASEDGELAMEAAAESAAESAASATAIDRQLQRQLETRRRRRRRQEELSCLPAPPPCLINIATRGEFTQQSKVITGVAVAEATAATVRCYRHLDSTSVSAVEAEWRRPRQRYRRHPLSLVFSTFSHLP